MFETIAIGLKANTSKYFVRFLNDEDRFLMQLPGSKTLDFFGKYAEALEI